MKKLSKANGKQVLKVLAGLTAILWLSACGKLVGVDVTVVDQKTALETRSWEAMKNWEMKCCFWRLSGPWTKPAN